jgi:putative FmdB family regulatory protein
MPLYDFRCRACNDVFEALVRPGDTPQCPSCRSTDLEKLPPSFVLDTDERRRAAARDSRKRQIAKRKDALIAEEEYRQKHDKE